MKQITDSDALTALLPASIKQDETIVQAAEAIGAQLAEVWQARVNVLNISRIDELSGTALDHLGMQWCPTMYQDGWSDEVKRAFIKSAVPTVQRQGTRWALDQVLSTFAGGVHVYEDMEPFTIQIIVNLNENGSTPALDSLLTTDQLIRLTLPAHIIYVITLVVELTLTLTFGGAVAPTVVRPLTDVQRLTASSTGSCSAATAPTVAAVISNLS